MSRPFTIVSILMFLALSALQFAWLFIGQPIVVNGAAIPAWASIVLLAVCIALMFGLWRELVVTDDNASATTSRSPTRAGSRSITRAKAPPVWQVDGQRLPADYFMFASRGVSVKSIHGAADKYDRVMVGFDAGNIPEAALKAAHDVGAELEIYVEGPGGPTGTSWSADEKARVKRASAKVGIDTSKSSWMHEWDDWGWKAYAYMQLEEFLGEGYQAAEIDNLSRVLGEGNDKLIEFYQDYGERCLAGHLPRMIMKNNSPAQMQAVLDAVLAGDLPREMFSEFHICEKGTGYNRKKLDEISAKMAVRTVASNDTFNYDAYGEYGLATAFAKLMPKPDTPVEAPASVPAPAPSPATTAPAAPVVVASADAAADAASRGRRS